MPIKTIFTGFSVGVATTGYLEISNPTGSGKRIQILEYEVTPTNQTTALGFVTIGRQASQSGATLLIASGIAGYSETLTQTLTDADIRKAGTGFLSSTSQGWTEPLAVGSVLRRVMPTPMDLPEGDCLAFYIVAGTNLDSYDVSITIREEDA